PSTTVRTLIIGMVASIGALITGWYAAQWMPTPPGVDETWHLLFYVGLWCFSAVAVSTVASRVIYGLRRQVARAQRFGQYLLDEKIGEGGMGVVYRARHALLRRPTAIKLLPPERAGDATAARFE